jgi:flagellin
MKIQTNTAANFALRNGQVNSSATERSIQRLSSGFRINRAGDDAAGLAIANTLRANNRALQQAQKNAAQATSVLQIVDGATQTIATVLDRMKELAMQSASDNSGTGSSTARANLAAEYTALGGEITRIVASTTFQGSAVFSATALEFVVSSSGTIANDKVSFTGSTGAAFTPAGDLSSDSGAETALTNVETAITALNTFIGNLGAAQSRVDFASSNVSIQLQNSQAAESSIRDADMAFEMTQFTKNNVLQQAAQSMLAQANQGSQGILQLLRG